MDSAGVCIFATSAKMIAAPVKQISPRQLLPLDETVSLLAVEPMENVF